MVDGLNNLAYTLQGDGPQIRPLYTRLNVRLDGKLLDQVLRYQITSDFHLVCGHWRTDI